MAQEADRLHRCRERPQRASWPAPVPGESHGRQDLRTRVKRLPDAVVERRGPWGDPGRRERDPGSHAAPL